MMYSTLFFKHHAPCPLHLLPCTFYYVLWAMAWPQGPDLVGPNNNSKLGYELHWPQGPYLVGPTNFSVFTAAMRMVSCPLPSPLEHTVTCMPVLPIPSPMQCAMVHFSVFTVAMCMVSCPLPSLLEHTVTRTPVLPIPSLMQCAMAHFSVVTAAMHMVSCHLPSNSKSGYDQHWRSIWVIDTD
jgi:hypothetical protein